MPNKTSVNEGGTVTWTITTTNFGTGTLYYTNNGTAVAADFSDNTNAGSVSIVNNSGSITKTIATDSSTEGSESIVMRLRTGSTNGTVVASAATVVINDTSLTPDPCACANFGLEKIIYYRSGSETYFEETCCGYYYNNGGTGDAADSGYRCADLGPACGGTSSGNDGKGCGNSDST